MNKRKRIYKYIKISDKSILHQIKASKIILKTQPFKIPLIQKSQVLIEYGNQ